MEWSDKNRMTFAPTKTAMLRLAVRNEYKKWYSRVGVKRTVVFGGVPLVKKWSHKVLGLKIQANLKFDMHYKEQVKAVEGAKGKL